MAARNALSEDVHGRPARDETTIHEPFREHRARNHARTRRVWARKQDGGGKTITLAMVADAMKRSGLELTDAELKSMVDSANQNLARCDEPRAIHIPNYAPSWLPETRPPR